jgi:hypothetical protein
MPSLRIFFLFFLLYFSLLIPTVILQPALLFQQQQDDMPSSPYWKDPQKVSSLLQSVFSVYTSRDPKQQWFTIQRWYAPNVTFEDPLMVVHDRESYRLQFLSLIKFFSQVKVQWKDAEVTNKVDWQNPEVAANVKLYELKVPGSLGPGTTDIVCENQQTYTLSRESWLAQKVLPETISLRVMTTVTVDDDVSDEEESSKEVVLRHQDVWPDSRPEFAWYIHYGKPVVGTVTSSVFQWLGW